MRPYSILIVLFFLSVPVVNAETMEDVFPAQSKQKPFVPFIVYQDKTSNNRYIPSGYMPTGECLQVQDNETENCHQGDSCLKVTYDVHCSAKSRRWAGMYWLNPADNWGDRRGGYNLKGATKLVFWARGEEGNEQIAEFKVGGVGMNREFPDSDTAAIGPVILSKEWREYTIDLRDKDLSYIAGGFAWIANVDGNPDACTFYLDDIRFE